MHECFVCMYVCILCASLVLKEKPEEGVKIPETGVIGDCDPSCRYWKLNLCSFKE